jgi:hypothetical protein
MNSTLKQLPKIAKNYIAFKKSQVLQSQLTKNINEKIYIADYLNIFSDFREIKYKMKNIDFHSIKHKNKEQDTFEFFELFFTKYIQSINIDINSNFIFILKKISNYSNTLTKILKKYNNINIRFIIIESKYNQLLLDKNKDDFLCQYLFCFLMENNDNCILISNDKYRDNFNYITKYKHIIITILKNNNCDSNCVIQTEIEMHSNILKLMNNTKYPRKVIPKNQLQKII